MTNKVLTTEDLLGYVKGPLITSIESFILNTGEDCYGEIYEEHGVQYIMEDLNETHNIDVDFETVNDLLRLFNFTYDIQVKVSEVEG